jgi:hypothetical protein
MKTGCWITGMQAFLLLVCTFEMGFFVFVFLDMNVHQQYMISDRIFETAYYKAILTITLAWRLLVVMMYVNRFRYKGAEWYTVGWIGPCVAFPGWWVVILFLGYFTHFLTAETNSRRAWLISFHEDAWHLSGVGVFCLGTFMYSLAMIKLSAREHTHLRQLYQGFEYALYAGSILCVPTFATLWFMNEPSAYIPEHLAYIFFLGFYMVFFTYHSPDPNKLATTMGDCDGADGRIPSQCRPLLAMDRPGMVIMTVPHAGP